MNEPLPLQLRLVGPGWPAIEVACTLCYGTKRKKPLRRMLSTLYHLVPYLEPNASAGASLNVL